MSLPQPSTTEQASDAELIHEIGRYLLQAGPPGWRRLDLMVRMAGGADDVSLTVILPDGSSPPVEAPPDLRRVLAELRQRRYEPGLGTWFSFRFTMDPPDKYALSYNFDYDPEWSPPLPSRFFLRDQELFPRTLEHIPDWLRARLDEAWQGAGGAA